MSGLSLILIAFLLSLAVAGLLLSRANEVCVLRVSGPKLWFVRGRMPQALFDQMTDALRTGRAHGTLKVVSEGGRPRLTQSGEFDPDLLQQLRNVVGMYPLAKLRAGSRPR